MLLFFVFFFFEIDKLVTIEPGIQVHSFTYLIPLNCPTSFEGKYGHIRYSINVIIQCSEEESEHRFVRIFTINNVMDLNYNSPLLKVHTHQPSTTNHSLSLDRTIFTGFYLWVSMFV